MTRWRTAAGLAALAALTLAGAADAAAADAPQLSAKDVCVAGFLDRDKLVASAAQVAGIDAQKAMALYVIDSKLTTEDGLRAFRVLLATEPNYTRFAQLLAGYLGEVTGDTRLKLDAFLLAQPAPRVACTTTLAPIARGSLVRAAASPAKATVPFRLRGIPDDLVYNSSSLQFAATSKATLSEAYAGSSKANTFQAQGALGYAINVGQFAALVPYGAASDNLVSTPGKPEKRTAETYDLGLAALWESPPTNFGTSSAPRYGEVLLIGRPDYLFNQVDGSRVAGLTLTAIPHLPIPFAGRGQLNSWVQPGGDVCKVGADCPWPLFEPLFDVRLYSGHYTDLGQPAAGVAPNADYLRVGTKFGLAVEVTKWVDVAATESLLYGAVGARRSLDYFQSSVTLNLDAEKRLGLTAAYKNGRTEDTAVRTESWTVGLSARY